MKLTCYKKQLRNELMLKKIIAYNDFLITVMNDNLDCIDINLAKRDDSTIFKQGELNVHLCGVSHACICSMCDVKNIYLRKI